MAALEGEVIRVGGIEVRPRDHVALASGKPLGLTVRELALLQALAARAGKIVTRDELYAAVWDRPFKKSDRSVDVYVKKLRTKLEDAMPGWCFIHTHFGFGYRFSPEPSQLFHTDVAPR